MGVEHHDGELSSLDGLEFPHEMQGRAREGRLPTRSVGAVPGISRGPCMVLNRYRLHVALSLSHRQILTVCLPRADLSYATPALRPRSRVAVHGVRAGECR